MTGPKEIYSKEGNLRAQYAKNLAQFADQLPELNFVSSQQLDDFMEPEMLQKYKAIQKNRAKFAGLGLGLGLGGSLLLTRLNPNNFLSLPKSQRIPIRLLAIGAPFLFGFFIGQTKNRAGQQQIENEFNTRLRKFKASRDFSDMDPNGLLFQQYQQKLNKGGL